MQQPHPRIESEWGRKAKKGKAVGSTGIVAVLKAAGEVGVRMVTELIQ